MNILCTICSDLVNQAENIYVTKCGHVFHHHCLMQWIERSKTCPQCRHKVTNSCMFRMYLTISNENTLDNAATLQSRLDDAQLQLRQQKAKFKEKEDKFDEINAQLAKNSELLKSYEKKLVSAESKVQAIRDQLNYANIQSKETQKLKEENTDLKKNLQLLNGLQKVLNATNDEVETMLKGYSDLRTVATFATALKRALSESESKRNESRDRLHAARQELAMEKKQVSELQAKILRLEDELSLTKHNHDMMKANEEMAELKKQIAQQAEEAKRILSRSTLSPFAGPKQDLNDAIVFNDTPDSSFVSPPGSTSIVNGQPDRPRRVEGYCRWRLSTLQRVLNDAMIYNGPPDSSFNTMVRKIESSDSPYLSLKQSSVVSLSALQRHPVNIKDGKTKPSDLVFKNAAKKHGNENKPSTSIFHKKDNITLRPLDDSHNTNNLDLSYDGLGGHSKLDVFPKPKPTPFKSCIPKLSAKHKLKRPMGTQDIDKMLKRFKDK